MESFFQNQFKIIHDKENPYSDHPNFPKVADPHHRTELLQTFSVANFPPSTSKFGAIYHHIAPIPLNALARLFIFLMKLFTSMVSYQHIITTIFCYFMYHKDTLQPSVQSNELWKWKVPLSDPLEWTASPGRRRRR